MTKKPLQYACWQRSNRALVNPAFVSRTPEILPGHAPSNNPARPRRGAEHSYTHDQV